MSSVKSPPQKKKKVRQNTLCEDGHLMGSTVLGERGQLVIPKDIRERLKLVSGAKLLVMNHPNGPIIIFPLEKMQSMLDTMTRQLTEATNE
jgi:AbrB family looped-hinge helix DNA binding protein